MSNIIFYFAFQWNEEKKKKTNVKTTLHWIVHICFVGIINPENKMERKNFIILLVEIGLLWLFLRIRRKFKWKNGADE